jgi:hypothetical protein
VHKPWISTPTQKGLRRQGKPTTGDDDARSDRGYGAASRPTARCGFDNLPEGLKDSMIAEHLREVCELDLSQLDAVLPPRKYRTPFWLTRVPRRNRPIAPLKWANDLSPSFGSWPLGIAVRPKPLG